MPRVEWMTSLAAMLWAGAAMAGAAQAPASLAHPRGFDEVRKAAELAQAIAAECAELQIDAERMAEAQEAAVARLVAAGVSVEEARTAMKARDEYHAVVVKQVYELTITGGRGRPDWCAAGRSEMRGGALIGSLLKEAE